MNQVKTKVLILKTMLKKSPRYICQQYWVNESGPSETFRIKECYIYRYTSILAGVG